MSRNKNTKNRPEETNAAEGPLAKTSFTVADRVYLRFGRRGAKLVRRLISLALFSLVIVADYILVLYTATSVLPNVAALIQEGTGTTLEMRIDAVIARWLIPVLFISAALLVAEVALMRRMWRWASDVSRKAGEALLRLDIEPKPPVRAAQKGPRTNRSTRITADS